ncbi:hypothetical protein [Flavobacterium sp. '19STA2R22 D10 B1']|uniref:hypothetical protein n=1 Tax=Flavobacterium aerium TaxID=3037261 RepID=UPI00278C0142|nr:hypothetical protein [Flavobacterium sp. '19STA2R22 D10 B1']
MNETFSTNQNWGLFDKNNSKHIKILSLLRTAQWTVSHPKFGEVADLERLSKWLKCPRSPINKPLKDMSNTELEKIISALEGIIKSRFK